MVLSLDVLGARHGKGYSSLGLDKRPRRIVQSHQFGLGVSVGKTRQEIRDRLSETFAVADAVLGASPPPRGEQMTRHIVMIGSIWDIRIHFAGRREDRTRGVTPRGAA
jgi:hypothetical protein